MTFIGQDMQVQIECAKSKEISVTSITRQLPDPI